MILILLGVLLIVLLIWWYRLINYWKFKKIPFVQNSSIFGNLEKFFKLEKCLTSALTEIYENKEMKNFTFFGIRIFHMPTILIKDPELIKNILVKDFDYFTDRLASSAAKSDPVGNANTFLMKSPAWKKTRSRLTHVFTIAKMKKMFYFSNQLGIQLNNLIGSQKLDSTTKSFVLEIKDVAVRYTTDNIASVAFGVQGNSIKDPNSVFLKFGKKIMGTSLLRIIEFGSSFFIPQLAALLPLLKFNFFSKDTTDFLRETIKGVMEEREKSGEIRDDLIDTLVTMKSEDKDKVPGNGQFLFQGDVLIAQAATLFTAGFVTTSAEISFGLFELSKNPIIQKRLKNEIKEVFETNNGELTYEAVKNMKYLEMVFLEISRLYPPLPYLERRCNKDYSMEPFSDFVIRKGTPVIIPICSIQRDATHFPDPNKFDPERFSSENRMKINPYTYMAFGAGPRKCIGELLGIMTSKIGIIYLLKDHFYRLADDTQDEIIYEPRAILLASVKGIYLNVYRDDS